MKKARLKIWKNKNKAASFNYYKQFQNAFSKRKSSSDEISPPSDSYC